MEEKLLPDKNPWVDLSTVTAFDQGSNLCSTRCIDESKYNVKKDKMIKKISSSSILISSLIKQLCILLEKDPIQSKQLYILLCDTMHKMKFIDPSYKLGGFEFVQDRYLEAVYHLVTVAQATIGSDNSVPIPRSLVPCVSIYQTQFREIGFIAAGGFGNVFKAVHKLDEVEYAIKKILVRPDRVETIMNHLEEVKTLAKLNHTNIVSYKQAWIETISPANMMQLPAFNESERSEFSFDKYRNVRSSQFPSSSNLHKSKKCHTFKSEGQKQSIEDAETHEKSSRTCESSSDVVSFKNNSETCDISIESHISSNNVEISFRNSKEENVSSEESLEESRVCQYSAQTNHYTILYIQMALCEKTLRQWINERTESTSISMVAAIASQILCGLTYIHSLKIVHHDIKPSNIFISTSGKLQVQLGDFGLACPLQRDSHDTIVGTCLYAAPEQLKGECNPKSDVYSLGIVLLELLIPMQTSMECTKIIQTLQAGSIPATFTASQLEWAKTICQLIEKNPSKRPSTSELFEKLKVDKDSTIAQLQNENDKLKHENTLLKNENKENDEIIETQRLKIEELLLKLAQLENQN